MKPISSDDSGDRLPNRSFNTQSLADFGLVVSAAMWGSAYFMIKGALDYVSALTLLSYRFIIAAAVLGLILVAIKRKPFMEFKWGIILGALLWLGILLPTLALRYTTASNCGFIVGLFVVFTPIIYFVFFRKRPNVYQVAAVLIATLGLWLLTGGVADTNLGDALSLLTAVVFSVYFIVVDRFVQRKAGPVVLTFQQSLVVGVLSIIAALVFKADLTVHGVEAWWAIIYLGLVASLAAFLIQLVAQKHTTPLRVALILSLESVFAALFAWTLGGETFVPIKAVGGGLIFFSIIISEKRLIDYIKNMKSSKLERKAS